MDPHDFFLLFKYFNPPQYTDLWCHCGAYIDIENNVVPLTGLVRYKVITEVQRGTRRSQHRVLSRMSDQVQHHANFQGHGLSCRPTCSLVWYRPGSVGYGSSPVSRKSNPRLFGSGCEDRVRFTMHAPIIYRHMMQPLQEQNARARRESHPIDLDAFAKASEREATRMSLGESNFMLEPEADNKVIISKPDTVEDGFKCKLCTVS